jgi:titin
VYDALHVWQAVPDAHVSAGITATSGGTGIGDLLAWDDLNIVGWFDVDDVLGPGILGVTFCGISPFSGLLDIDILINNNPAINWDSDDADGIGAGEFSLSEVNEHEFGHSFGLGHTSTGCASGSPPLMCPSAQVGTRTFLRSDDINGITNNFPLSGSPPGPPSTLAAAQAGSNASLTWSVSSGSVIAYDIERSTGGCGGAFKSVATVPATTSFTDTNFAAGLPPGNICYRMKALGPGGDSPYSNTAALTAGPPAAPRWTSASPLSSSQVQLNWSDQSGNENGFVIYRYGAGLSTEAGSVGPNQTTFTDIGLTPGVHYIYSILSHNNLGFSLAANTITAITPGGVPSPPVLESVVGISTTQVRLTWRDNSSNEAGFQVFRFDPLNPGAGYIGLGSLAPNTTTFTDSGLAPGQTYIYWIVAQNGLFSGFSPAIFSGTTFSATPDPEAPQLTGGTTVSSSEVSISWTDSTADESGFRVRRWDGASWQLVATLAAGSTAFGDSGLAAGTVYQYQVSAFNDDYEKVSPAAVSVTTAGTWPAPPALTSAVGLSETSIRVRWQDNSSNETGFLLIRTDSVTGASTQINLPSGSTTFLDGGLTPGRYYYYWVWALGSQGNGYAGTIIPANTFAP